MPNEQTWSPDPTRGGPEIEARKKEVISNLKSASDVAFYHIDQQLALDIEQLKQKAGETRKKIVTYVNKAEKLPALTVVRKYWKKDSDSLMHHLTDTIMRNSEQ